MMDRRAHALALLGGWVLSSLVLLARCTRSWDTVVDDAFISARYAEHLAAGHGLVYNAGKPPVEGYTNLLWTVSLAGLRALDTPVHEAMIGMAFGWGVLGLLGVVLVTDALLDGPPPWLAVLPAVWLALTPHYAVVATNGLETTQFLAWTLLAAAALWRSEGPGRWGAAMLLAGLSAVRPEGVAVAAGLSLFDTLARRDALGRVGTWAPWAGTLLGVAAVTGWRLWTYGAWVPNTAAAKAEGTWLGTVEHNLGYLGGDPSFWIGMLVLAGGGAAASRWSWRKGALLAIAAGLVLVASRVELWMPGGRLLVLPVALLLPVAVAPLEGLRTGPRRGLRTGLAVLMAVFVMWCAVGRPDDWQHRRDARHSVVSHNPARGAGEHLARHLPPGSRLATRDAGLLAWSVGTDVRVDELHPRALTLPHPDGADVDWRTAFPDAPAAVALTVNAARRRPFYYPTERRLWRHWSPTEYRYLGRVEQHFRRYYDIYVRADLAVPPLDPGLVTNTKGRIPRTTVHVAEGVSPRPAPASSRR
jgi:arabinofuranosyltransferase